MSYTFFSKQPYFIPVTGPENIPLAITNDPYSWYAVKDPKQFHSQDKTVQIGNKSYLITTKLERKLHTAEKWKKGALAFLATLPLGIGLFFAPVRLLWKDAIQGKSVRRYGVLQSTSQALTTQKVTTVTGGKITSNELPRVEVDRYGYISDPKYYPDFVDYPKANSEFVSYMRDTTFDPVKSEEPIKAPFALPKPAPTSLDDVEAMFKSKFKLRLRDEKFKLRLEAAMVGSIPPEILSDFVIDGQEWKPGDMIIDIELTSPIDIGCRFLPVSLLAGKKPGDVIEFKSHGKAIALQIDKDFDRFESILDVAKKEITIPNKDSRPLYRDEAFISDLQTGKALTKAVQESRGDQDLYKQMTVDGETPPKLDNPRPIKIESVRTLRLQNKEIKVEEDRRVFTIAQINQSSDKPKIYFYKEWIAIVFTFEEERKRYEGEDTIVGRKVITINGMGSRPETPPQPAELLILDFRGCALPEGGTKKMLDSKYDMDFRLTLSVMLPKT